MDFYLVDAFTNKFFCGNPAAVCPCDRWEPDIVLHQMACEHNQSETAFYVPSEGGFELRWFTTGYGEIDLCGHATLAAAHVIFNHTAYNAECLKFKTRFSGDLVVEKNGEWLKMDFPAWAPKKLAEIPTVASSALGGVIIQDAYIKRDYMFVLETEADVLAVKPDFKQLALLGQRVCVTAPGKNSDFVSRFFCPGDAREEDPVTGSAHVMLAPYWAKRLGQNKLRARQLSSRGGELYCEMAGERVYILGQARTYMQGKIFLS